MKNKSKVFIACGILFLFVVTPLVYTYLIRETPPIIICNEYDEMINDCESTEGVSLSIGFANLVLCTKPNCDTNCDSISFSYTGSNISEIETRFDVTLSSNYKYINFSYYICDETYYNKIHEDGIELIIGNQTSLNTSIKSFLKSELIIGWINLSCSYNELNIPDETIDIVVIRLPFDTPQSNIDGCAYTIDNIYRHYEICIVG